jgi:hypothetical protein
LATLKVEIAGYRFEWEANVIVDWQINAFCLPGGKIAVYLDGDRFWNTLTGELARISPVLPEALWTCQQLYARDVDARHPCAPDDPCS